MVAVVVVELVLAGLGVVEAVEAVEIPGVLFVAVVD